MAHGPRYRDDFQPHILVLTLTGAREIVVRMIPPQIDLGLSASIGLFIAMLGCRDAGMVAINQKSHALALGDFSQPGVIVALIGLAVAVALQTRRIPGAVLAGIVAAALAGIPCGLTTLSGTISLPHPLAPVALRLDVAGALTIAALPYMFAFFAGEFFSTKAYALRVRRGYLAMPPICMNRPIPAHPQQLGNSAGIFPIGLHGHRRKCRLHVSRLQQNNVPTSGNKPSMQPMR